MGYHDGVMRSLALLATLGVAATSFGAILVDTGFNTTSVPPYVAGPLDTQNGWIGLGSADFIVTASAGVGGSQGVVSDSSAYSSAFAYLPFASQTAGLVVTRVRLNYNDSTPATRADNSAFGLEGWNASGTESYGTLVLGANGRPMLRGGSADAVFQSTLPITNANTWYDLILVVAPGLKKVDGYVNQQWLGQIQNNTTATGLTGLTDVDLVGYSFGAVASDYGVDPLNGGFNAATFDDYKVETLPVGAVRGTVTLENFVGAVNGRAVTVEVRNTSGTVLETLNTSLDASGQYTVAPVSRGNLSIAVKASHWLARAYSINHTDMGSLFGSVSLLNGDVTGDNEIGPSDFSALSLAFGSFLGDPNFNAEADLNGDDEVGPGDFSILAGNFGQFGD